MNWKRRRGKQYGIIKGTTETLTWRERGKPQNPSVTLNGFSKETRTR